MEYTRIVCSAVTPSNKLMSYVGNSCDHYIAVAVHYADTYFTKCIIAGSKTTSVFHLQCAMNT